MANIFCKVKDIPGESTEKKDYFEVQNVSWSVAQHASGAVSGTGGQIAAKPDFSDIVLNKQIDSATSLLALKCAQGTHIGEVLIEFYRNIGGTEPSKYIEYKLTNAVIRSTSFNGSEGSFATESVALGWDKLEWTYTQYDNTGKKVKDIKGSWDMTINKGK